MEPAHQAGRGRRKRIDPSSRVMDIPIALLCSGRPSRLAAMTSAAAHRPRPRRPPHRRLRRPHRAGPRGPGAGPGAGAGHRGGGRHQLHRHLPARGRLPRARRRSSSAARARAPSRRWATAWTSRSATGWRGPTGRAARPARSSSRRPRRSTSPTGVDLEVAAAVMLQGITAHYLVNSTYAVQPGDLVLAHAVAGGVGQLLVQLVKAKGATLIGTAGSAEKVALGLRARRRPRHRLLAAVRPRRAAREGSRS